MDIINKQIPYSAANASSGSHLAIRRIGIDTYRENAKSRCNWPVA